MLLLNFLLQRIFAESTPCAPQETHSPGLLLLSHSLVNLWLTQH